MYCNNEWTWRLKQLSFTTWIHKLSMMWLVQKKVENIDHIVNFEGTTEAKNIIREPSDCGEEF